MNIAEQPLLHSIQQGDERAFEALYREFYNFLCRFACTLLNDDILAEEVVDDVMIRLWDRRMELKDISLKGYLLRSVRNSCINTLKSQDHQQRNLTQHVSSEERMEFISSLFDSQHPLEQLLYSEMADQLQKAINDMPEETRRVYRMVRVENMKYTEVAKQLDISVNTVKYHMKNAVRFLNDKLSRLIILSIAFKLIN